MTTPTRPCPDVLPATAAMSATHPRHSRPARLPTCRTSVAAYGRPGRRPAGPRLLVPGGHLRGPDAHPLRRQVDASLTPGADLVLDLVQVQSVDAEVVGVLVAADRRLQSTGARLVLAGVQPRVARALGVAGAQRLLG